MGSGGRYFIRDAVVEVENAGTLFFLHVRGDKTGMLCACVCENIASCLSYVQVRRA